jgi:hypothetical protein
MDNGETMNYTAAAKTLGVLLAFFGYIGLVAALPDPWWMIVAFMPLFLALVWGIYTMFDT